MMDAVATAWKERLLTVVKPHAGKPLFFSGGMDSATLLAASLELGAKPELYTVALDGRESADLRAARVATKFGLQLHVAVISTEIEELIDEVRALIGLIESSRKAAVQCCHPVWHMASLMHQHGHRHAILGTCHIALDGRRVAVMLSQEGEEATRVLRAERYGDRHRVGHPTWHMHGIARKVGIDTCEPYSDEPLQTYALSLDMAELNRPVEKGIAVRAFPWFFERFKPRRSAPLQIGSGIRELHDELLTSRANARGHKAVVAVYNDMLREISEPSLF